MRPGNRLLIVVPARGGSKGIPRKNLRVLDGIPLIGHVIKTAQRMTDADLLVSTEDDEIAEVAAWFGAEVRSRPQELAEDATPLDPVVIDAWQYAESIGGGPYRWVATMQPTAPLVSLATLNAALTMMEAGEIDCCITVQDARHLYWQGADPPKPLWRERKNRQWLEPFWKETGAVIVAARSNLDQQRRITGRVGMLPMPEHEAVDIDTYDDWLVVERRLQSPRIIIRIRGNQLIGLGHAYRQVSLARRFFVPDLLFAADADSKEALALAQSEGHQVCSVAGDEEFLDRVREGGFNLVINDILDTTSAYIDALKSCGAYVITFEDLGAGADRADLVINALYEYSSPRSNQRFGWRYVCLREEFLRLRALECEQAPSPRVLITFGGTDPNDLTSRAVRACSRMKSLSDGIELTVVLGLANARQEPIAELVQSVRHRFAAVRVLAHVRNMSTLMHRSTLAVTSNGRTVYELASLGIPMITMSQNPREASHTFARLSGGAMDLGLAAGVTDEDLKQAIETMLAGNDRRQEMRTRLLSFDLRSGTDRVVDAILVGYHQWRQARASTNGLEAYYAH
jgi:spore coat polysaccharide biosynthesis predicted glycosyltransferase SpsG/CMP-N-acetylneuraminic acid synthetase